MRLVVLGAVLFVVAACSGPHWIGDGVEPVEGYWIMDARICSDPGCAAAARAALLAIGDPESKTVTRVRVAQWTGPYVDERGSTQMQTISGPPGIAFFLEVLELRDGSRRLVPIACAYESGAPAAERWNHCGPDGMDHAYNRVGHEPWLGGPQG